MNKKYNNRLRGLTDLASISIKENTVKKTGFDVLKKCYDRRRVSGYGSFTFMLELMKKCKKDQVKDVMWLFNECMPNTYILAMEGLLRERIRMHARHFQSRELNYCLHSLTKKWKAQGKVRKNFLPIN